MLQVNLLRIQTVLLRAGTSHVSLLISRSRIAILLCMAYREKISRHIKVWQTIRPSAGKPDRTHGRMLRVSQDIRHWGGDTMTLTLSMSILLRVPLRTGLVF